MIFRMNTSAKRPPTTRANDEAMMTISQYSKRKSDTCTTRFFEFGTFKTAADPLTARRSDENQEECTGDLSLDTSCVSVLEEEANLYRYRCFASRL